MAKKQGGLGRNFYSLLEDNQIMTENKAVERISLNKIEPRKDQPRKDFDQEALQALADSIAIHDVIQPIVVRDLGFKPYIAPGLSSAAVSLSQRSASLRRMVPVVRAVSIVTFSSPQPSIFQ